MIPSESERLSISPPPIRILTIPLITIVGVATCLDRLVSKRRFHVPESSLHSYTAFEPLRTIYIYRCLFSNKLLHLALFLDHPSGLAFWPNPYSNPLSCSLFPHAHRIASLHAIHPPHATHTQATNQFLTHLPRLLGFSMFGRFRRYLPHVRASFHFREYMLVFGFGYAMPRCGGLCRSWSENSCILKCT